MVRVDEGVHAARLHAATLGLFFAASSTPSPLYRLYQQQWSFSPLMLSTVFSLYALTLLAALLMGGGLSDQLGRRRVILAALAGEGVAMLAFLLARDVRWLLAARLVQGLATGLAASSLGAAILDADHRHGPLRNATVPVVGLGAGALGSALLAHAAPWPLHLGFALLLVLFIVQAFRTAALHEPSPMRTAPLSLRPRIAVPAPARAVMLAVTPAVVATWALGGFYLSLLPSLLSVVVGGSGGLTSGAATALLCATAVAATLVARRHAPRLTLPLGAAGILCGTGFIVVGAHEASLAALLAGSVLAGIGFGAGYYGAVSSVMPLAAPQERGGLMAAFYVECYLANALPVIVAGLLVRPLGLLPTADLFAAAVMTLSALAILVAIPRLLRSRRSAAREAV